MKKGDRVRSSSVRYGEALARSVLAFTSDNDLSRVGKLRANCSKEVLITRLG
jgi:hypothetical protein